MHRIQKFYHHIKNDSLYRNSLFLLASNLLVSGLGFVFWAVAARLFSTENVGLGSTMISMVDLLSVFAILGLNISLVRYLPTSTNKNEKINTTFTIIFLTSIAVAITFILGLDLFSPDLLFIKQDLIYVILFILYVIISSLSQTIKSIFRAYLSSQYVLVKNAIFNFSKICLLFVVTSLGSFGLLTAWMNALLVAVIASIYLLTKKFSYVIKPEINQDVIKRMARFSVANYISEFFERAPKLVLPLIITNLLGPEQTAYYFISMSLAGFIFMIPEAISSSYYAEGSADENNLKENTFKVLKAYAITLVPTTAVLGLFGNYLLLIFGKEYSTEGWHLLQLFIISGIPVALNAMFAIITRIKHLIKELVIINGLGAITIVALTYGLINGSVLGVGWAWLAGQITMNVLYLFAILRYKSS